MRCRAVLALLSLILMLLSVADGQLPDRKRIALTFDDLPMAVAGNDQAAGHLSDVQRINAALLDVLARHHAQAVGFVNEIKLNVAGERDARSAVLQQWLAAGLDLGNHTYSHHALSESETAAYEDDFVRGTTITSAEMRAAGKTEKYFRYPYLDTGKDKNQRDELSAFYTARGYLNAPVTAQNEDWLFNVSFCEAVAKRDVIEQRRIADAYLQHTSDQLAYSEELSRRSFGREIPQIMLMHADELNAAQLDAVLVLMEKRGYSFVTLDEALGDPAYSTRDDYAGPDGLIWLERWQLALGKPILSTLPVTPKWAQDAYQRITGQKP